MTGQLFIAALALVAIVAVLVWTVADHLAESASEPEGPVLFDRSGRFIATTQDLPVYAPRHRAPRGWSS